MVNNKTLKPLNTPPPKIAPKTCPANIFAKSRILKLKLFTLCDINSIKPKKGCNNKGAELGIKKAKIFFVKIITKKIFKAINADKLKYNGI
jgi:hypothetical protein